MSLEKLFAEVFADPESDDKRRVLADALVEAGDPRGEFINLQLQHAAGIKTPQSERREQQLIRERGPRLHGRLADWCNIKNTYFERGFPSGVDAGHGRGDPGHEWNTVKELRLLSSGGWLFAKADFTSLEWLGTELLQLGRREWPVPSLKTLQVATPAPEEIRWEEHLRLFPALQRLSLWSQFDARSAHLTAAAVPERVREVQFIFPVAAYRSFVENWAPDERVYALAPLSPAGNAPVVRLTKSGAVVESTPQAPDQAWLAALRKAIEARGVELTQEPLKPRTIVVR